MVNPGSAAIKGIVFCVGLVVTLVLAGVTAASGATVAAGVVLVLGLLAAILITASVWIMTEWERGIILQLGRFQRVAGPGMYWVIPAIQQVIRVVDTRLVTRTFTGEQIMTADNVPLGLQTVLRYVVVNPRDAVLNVENYASSVEQAAQTALQEAIGRTRLDDVLRNRLSLEQSIQASLDRITNPWGIDVQAVEIRDIVIPSHLQQVMAREAEAQREGRARLILAQTESDAAQLMQQAAQTYGQNAVALMLRSMQMLLEVARDQSTFFIVPPSGFAGLDVTAMAAAISEAIQGKPLPAGPSRSSAASPQVPPTNPQGPPTNPQGPPTNPQGPPANPG